MEIETHQATSTNPFTGEVVFQQKFMTEDEINKRIQDSWTAFMTFRTTDLKTRSERLNRLADVLDHNMDKIAKTITTESGKTIKQSRKEVTGAVRLIRYYVQHTQDFLRPDEVKVEGAKRSYVRFDPLGPIYHISSYNYPLYQSVRRAVPALLMGNTVLNRPSSITPQTGMLIEQLYREAGFTNGEFLNLIISQTHSEVVIRNPLIRAVSYIGSASGGQFIGSLTGKYSKKFVSDQGGNNAFIVMKDANLEWAVNRAIGSRVKNAGQSGLSPKTFLIEESVYDSFRNLLIERLKQISMGDPMDMNTVLGPLSNKQDLQKTLDQLKRAQEQGAKLVYGGVQPKEGPQIKGGLFFMPTVLEVQEGNVLLSEETFAPIIPLMRWRTEEDIIRLSNSTPFGFGVSIFTKDETRAERLVPMLDVGSVFINQRVRPYPELPIGGVKLSGVGREGGLWGTREWCNIKSVYVSGVTTVTK